MWWMSTRLLRKKKYIYRILANRYIYNLIRKYSIIMNHQHNKNRALKYFRKYI